MKNFKLKIVSPEKVLFSEEVSQVSVATTTGQITILAQHLPLVSTLAAGEIVIKKDNQESSVMAVAGGLVEVLSTEVVILADRIEYATEIDEARAEEAKQRAEKALKEKHLDSEEFAALSANLEKEMNRLRVARKYKQQGIRTGHK